MPTEAKTGDKPAKSAKAVTKPKAAAPKKPAAKTAAKTAAPKKPAAKSAVPKAAKPKAAPKTAAKKVPALSPDQRRYYVEVAAYYMAERRGFQGGDPAGDWLAAEAEIDRLLQEGVLKP